MGIVLQGEFTGDSEIDYKVEIHDSEYSGDVNDLTFSGSGFSLDYMPVTDDILAGPCPSDCTLHLMNTGGYFNSDFLPNLELHQQNRFSVRIFQYDGGQYNLFWVGWIVQDYINIVEASQPYEVEITCSDGLGVLKDEDFDLANTLNDPNRTPITSLIIDTILKNGLVSMWGADDEFLITAFDWWESAQSYSATEDSLSDIYYDTRAFFEIAEDGSREFPSCFEVLEQICTVFQARLSQSGGAYRFEQIRQHTQVNRKRAAYKRSGVQISVSSSDEDKSIGNTRLGARVVDNQESFLPAATFAKISYNQTVFTPDVGQYYFASNGVDPVDFEEIGFISNVNSQALSIDVNYRAICDGSINIFKKTKATIKLEIKLTDASTNIEYYWVNSNDGRWITGGGSSTAYEFDTNSAVPYDLTYFDYSSRNVTTQALPATGELEIRCFLDGFYQRQGNGNYTDATPTTQSLTANVTITMTDSDDRVFESVFSAKNSNTDIGDSTTVDLDEVKIGDGKLEMGRLYTSDGSNIVSTSEWRVGNSGSYTNLLKLCTLEALGMLSLPTAVYDGDIYASVPYHKRLTWDSQGYTPMNVSWNARTGIYSGRWAVMAYDGENVAEESVFEKRRRLQERIRSNATQNDLPDGRVGGVEIGQRKGQIDEEAEYQFESSGIQAGVDETVIIAEAGYYKQLMGVFVKVTSVGSVDYNSATANVRYEGFTEDLVNATDLVNAINQGKATFLPIISGTETRTGVAIKLTIDASAAAGDHEYQVIPLYRSFEDTAEPRLDMVPPLALPADGESTTDFDANWESVEGADGYKLDVAEDDAFTVFVSGYNDKDVGNVLTDNVSGLIAETTYYYRVRAYNDVEESDNSNVIEVETVPNFFISTWNTENAGTSNNDQIKLPLTSTGSYNFQVYYDDTLIKSVTTHTDSTITFPDGAGIKEIQIRGSLRGWSFNNGGDYQKITGISNYGVLAFSSDDSNHFHGCLNLDVSASDSPDLSLTERLDNCFRDCIILTAIGNWDVSGITLFSSMFRNCFVFNQDISGWDTGLATNLSLMFFSARAFNQDISTWNVSSCTRFSEMFRDAEAFNQPIGTWNVSSGTRFDLMFFDAISFNQSLNAWNMSAATNISTMFRNAIAYNQPMNLWNVSTVTTADQVFRGATGFDQNLELWDVSSMTNLTQFLFGVDLSTSNYDALLVGWSGLPSVQNSVSFDGGLSTYTKSISDSGTNTGTGATLIEAGQNFLTTVTVGDVVQNTSALTFARVQSVDSDTQLTLDSAIMNNGDGYEIESSSAAKGRASLILDYSWTITDNGGV